MTYLQRFVIFRMRTITVISGDEFFETFPDVSDLSVFLYGLLVIFYFCFSNEFSKCITIVFNSESDNDDVICCFVGRSKDIFTELSLHFPVQCLP